MRWEVAGVFENADRYKRSALSAHEGVPEEV